MKVKKLIFGFICDDLVKGSATKLRGYFADRFGEYTLIHHHLDDGRLFYRFPLVQYKIFDGKPFVVGINEGADVLQNIYEEIEYLKIGHREYQIREKRIILRADCFGTTEDFKSYTFLTPWLALNQKNYRQWQGLSREEKQEMLKKALIGNILSMAKGLEYVVTEEIKAEVDVRPLPTTLKGVPMIGFLGEFCVNFNIPDYLGIGKSVSRGFGTIKRMSKMCE